MPSEYLVSYGLAGDFSRFRSATEGALERGDRVILRTRQGLELGEVLCSVTDHHDRFLSGSAAGDILRRATAADEQCVDRIEERSQQLFETARQLAAELALPLEIMDAEFRFDGAQAILHHLRRQECDFRPLVSALARRFDVPIVMENWTLPEEPAERSCGRPGCGKEAGGSCTSCGSGGGCGSGCGRTIDPDAIATYLAHLDRNAASSRLSLL